MHFVLIHWKILRTEQAVHDFLQYWSEVLTIPDRAGVDRRVLESTAEARGDRTVPERGGAAGHASVLFLCQSWALGGCARLPGAD